MENEEWKSVVGFEISHLVSSYGRVKNILTGNLLKPWIGTTGYRTIRLKGGSTNKTIHILVCKAFVPNPSNFPCVNHKDGIKANCSSDNLEWCTHAFNNRHALLTGLRKMPSGRMHYLAKKVIDNSTGIIYDTVKSAANGIGVNSNTVRSYLCGYTKNKTSLAYYQKEVAKLRKEKNQ